MARKGKNQSMAQSLQSHEFNKIGTTQAAEISIDDNFRSILHNTLAGVMKITVGIHSIQTAHDRIAVDFHLQNRAEASVRQELEKYLNRMGRFESPSTAHVLTAYSQLSANLLSDLEEVTVRGDLFKRMFDLKNDNLFLKSESTRLHSSLSDTVARKEQQIKALEAEREIIECKNKSLMTAIELLERELENSRRVTTELNEANVELCMKCCQITGEVQRQSKVIKNAVQVRLGFVPSNIKKQLSKLCKLKVIIPTTGDSISQYDKLQNDEEVAERAMKAHSSKFTVLLDTVCHSLQDYSGELS